jgi:hypothetical protein
MTELLPFKCWHFSVTKFIAKVCMCLVTWHSAYVQWVISHKFWAFFENGLFDQSPKTTNLGNKILLYQKIKLKQYKLRLLPFYYDFPTCAKVYVENQWNIIKLKLKHRDLSHKHQKG